MPDRVAVHRIVVGQDKERRVIMPGTRFNTDECGIDAEQLERFDRAGALREPRDQAKSEGEMTPSEESKLGLVVEGRSGPATGVTNPPPGEVVEPPPTNEIDPPQARRETDAVRRRRDHEL